MSTQTRFTPKASHNRLIQSSRIIGIVLLFLFTGIVIGLVFVVGLLLLVPLLIFSLFRHKLSEKNKNSGDSRSTGTIIDGQFEEVDK